MEAERRLSIGDKLTLLWGKIRRFYYHTCRPDYISRSHKRRRGTCLRCGVCCQIGARCPHYEEALDGLSLCKRHLIRPRNCRVFPIDERDIADRNILAPDIPCGYGFVAEEAEREGVLQAETPILATEEQEVSAE